MKDTVESKETKSIRKTESIASSSVSLTAVKYYELYLFTKSVYDLLFYQ